MSGPLSGGVFAQNLEDELQAQLDGAVAARAENGIEGGVVRGGTATTECTRL